MWHLKRDFRDFIDRADFQIRGEPPPLQHLWAERLEMQDERMEELSDTEAVSFAQLK